ncbi:hypothetical protein DFH09DRAFT_1480905 [Mycena vulgaris]|nr:hypothetical protein DFH09DRAFT_1480905 [Mycena vulgaris]
MNDLSLNDLAGCNNRLCQAGCGWYQPSAHIPGVSVASTPCIICGCLAAQHYRPPPKNSVPAGASPLPPPPGSLNDPVTTGVPGIPPAGASMQQPPAGTGFSATARTLFGSRPAPVASGSSLAGSTAAPDGFRRLAQARKQAADSLPVSTTFYPALNAQKEADLNPLASGSRKRKKKNTDPRSASSASHDRNVKPKIAKQTPCVLIWIPFTKDVNRGRCYIPAAHTLVVLAEAGYVQDVIFSADDTPDDIRTKILVCFESIRALATQHGFRLLVTQKEMMIDKRGKVVPKLGVPRVLRPLQGGLDLMAVKTQVPYSLSAMTDSNVRQSGPRFRRLVFIALGPTGPNLPLRGVVYPSDDDLDRDLLSDERSETSDESGDDDESESTMSDSDSMHRQSKEKKSGPTGDISAAQAAAQKSSKLDTKARPRAGEGEVISDRKGKEKAHDEGTRFETGYFDDDFAKEDTVLDDDDKPEPPAPDPRIPKPTIPEAHLRLVRLLENMEAPDAKPSRASSWWAAHGVGCFILGTKSSEICAGILDGFLSFPYQSVLTPAQILAFIQSNICRPFLMLTKLSGRLLGAAERVGSDEFEAEFDRSFAIGPGGLGGLMPYIYPAYCALPVALGLGASPEAVSEVYDELVDLSYAFLRCIQHLRFKHNRSQCDPRGGCRELCVILETKDCDLPIATPEDFSRLDLKLLVDALDKTDPNVSEINFLLMDAFGDASNPREMTKERVVKGGEYGMRRFYALVVAPSATHASAPDANFATTSKAAGQAQVTGEDNKASEEMTNTDLLESGWAYDCSAGEPDINVRRAQRHPEAEPQTSRPQKSKSPPIVISSDSESSDGSWARTWERFKRQSHHGAPPPQANTTQTGPPPPPAPAAPAPAPVPPAQPAWMDPDALEEDGITDAEGLLRRSSTRYWQGVMREVIERFPHPEPQRRLTMDILLAPGVTRSRQYHMLSLAYHVDRNVSGGAHWLRVAGILSQILNDTRSYKWDDPRISLSLSFSFLSVVYII